MMKVHHAALTVNNLDESIRFYTGVLGFEIVKRFERKDMDGKAAFIQLGNFELELWEFRNMKENSDAHDDINIKGIRHIAFEVNDLKKAIDKLKKKGMKFSAPQMGASGHMYSFSADPNGIALEFYEK